MEKESFNDHIPWNKLPWVDKAIEIFMALGVALVLIAGYLLLRLVSSPTPGN